MSNMDAVRFRDQALRAAKTHIEGTHRSVSPEATFQHIRPWFGRFGVTRLANITGLDRAGLPVVLAIRPNSRTLSNSSGKGITLTAARVSAAMEALEMYSAENIPIDSPPRTFREISSDWPTIAIERLTPARYNLFSFELPQHWLFGWDLIHGHEVAVPLSLVSLGPIATGFDRLTLWADTNGLASGNNLLEAVTAGLLEVIERDAVACQWLAWDRTGQPPPLVSAEAIQSGRVQRLIEQLSEVQIGVILFDCTIDTCVPTYVAFVHDERERYSGIFRGAGAHLDPEVAMLRAITEAIQARVVYAAGSRDDLSRRGLVSARLHDDRTTVDRLTSAAHTSATARASEATPTFEGDVHLLREKLVSAGISQLIVLDITPPGFDAAVVRVIAPGLEGVMWRHYAAGPRAEAFAAGSRR